MTTINVHFETPATPAPLSQESLAAFADALRERPGMWAFLRSCTTPGSAGQSAYEIRKAARNYRPFKPFSPAGDFEAEARTIFGEHRVYVRYVGTQVTR